MTKLLALFALAGLLGFDPAATVRALGHAEARAGALRQLLGLGAVELATARRDDQLVAPIAAVVGDGSLPVADRILAARALALLGRRDGAVEPLAAQTRRGDTPEETAVAREAARALRQLGAVEALGPATAAVDPEVRAIAAGAGAAPESLCVVARADPWPAVRAAAARGLVHHPARSDCLAEVLTDDEPVVGIAAAHTLGQTAPAATRPALRRVAGDAGAPVPLRGEAVIALARLGDLEPATRILATHLDEGGIVPLAEAAVTGLAASPAPQAAPLLRRALESGTPSVRIAAARALAARDDPASRAAFEAFRDRLPPTERRRLLPPDHVDEPAGPDPAADDPE